MKIEYERKFLVDEEKFSKFVHATRTNFQYIRQGYFANPIGKTIRVRIVDNRHAQLCIKLKVDDIIREEYKYSIPLQDAIQMMKHIDCIEKTRYTFIYKGSTWDIDYYMGKYLGLVIGACEFENKEKAKSTQIPDWCVKEITGDDRYKTSNMIDAIVINGSEWN